MAVNNSLVQLSKQGIFCTEPYRIPLAGKIDVCCFDKTGTLTAEGMKLKGVVQFGRRVLSTIAFACLGSSPHLTCSLFGLQQ